jgi:hypothetical protein
MSNPKGGPIGPITVPTDRITFEYRFADGYRTHHVDGATGGVTPNGFIHFAVYSEKFELPVKQTFRLGTDGTIGAALDGLVSTRKIVRELSADIMVSLATARGLRDWLSERITELEGISSKSCPRG